MSGRGHRYAGLVAGQGGHVEELSSEVMRRRANYLHVDKRSGTQRPGPDTALGRVALTKRVVQVADLRESPQYKAGEPFAVTGAELGGIRSLISVPMLKEGETAEKRDGLRAFLKKNGYRTGHVTIDNSDWIVDDRLRARLVKDPHADLKPYRDYYLEHMWDRAIYYDDLARKVTGRNVKHTLLTHFNLLNGLFLGDLMAMFKQKGWQLIDAEEAYKDPVFDAQPKVLPAGESIVWSLAKASGTIAKDLRYPAEDGEYERAAMDRLGL